MNQYNKKVESQESYSSDSFRSSASMTNEHEEIYSSDEDNYESTNKKSRRLSRSNIGGEKSTYKILLKNQEHNFISSDNSGNDREDSLVTNSSKDTAKKEKEKQKKVSKESQMNIVENNPAKMQITTSIKSSKYSETPHNIKERSPLPQKNEIKDMQELDTIAEEDNNTGDVTNTSNGLMKGITIRTSSNQGNSSKSPY